MIIAGKFTKLAEIHKKIEQYVLLHRDEILRPVNAFITFENQEGYERAVDNFPKSKRSAAITNVNQMLKDKLIVEEAPEPSNIIWENLHFTATQ